MGNECRIIRLDPWTEVKIAFSNHSKSEAVFGTSERASLKLGVRTMAECVEKHGARESGVFEQIEVSKNMPPSWTKLVRGGV
jgi:UDP-glucose 4-epimerase